MLLNIPGYWPVVAEASPVWLSAPWLLIVLFLVVLPGAALVVLVRRRRLQQSRRRHSFSQRIQAEHEAAVVSRRRGARVESRRR